MVKEGQGELSNTSTESIPLIKRSITLGSILQFERVAIMFGERVNKASYVVVSTSKLSSPQ